MNLRVTDLLINAVAAPFPIVASVSKVAQTQKLELFVEATPGVGESFEVLVEARPRADASFTRVGSVIVSESEPVNSGEVTKLGTDVRISVIAGGAEVAFTGKVYLVKVYDV